MKAAFEISPAAPLANGASTALRVRLSDFYELTKPRMNALVVITAGVGFWMASRSGSIDWLLLLHTVLGTALTASSAAVLNQLIEREHDAKMPRTADRPLAAGRLLAGEALVFAAILGLSGVVYLTLAVNLLTAGLGAATLLLYVALYTPLKRLTSLNTIVGAIPGAIPPLMGFTAVQNTISVPAWTLFAVLFFWQMPHFLAIAILYRDDYAAAGFRMLPVDDLAGHLTGRMIVLYTAALIPITLLPSVVGLAGRIYFAAAVVLGLAFLVFSLRCALTPQRINARRLFLASIIYLPLLLAVLMLDKR